eukprot:1627491-Rhodomonas_salina.1
MQNALFWTWCACCYARAMRCPVLSSRMVLRAGYAMSGTELAYGAARGGGVWACATEGDICLRARYAVSGTDPAYGAMVGTGGEGGSKPLS